MECQVVGNETEKVEKEVKFSKVFYILLLKFALYSEGKGKHFNRGQI